MVLDVHKSGYYGWKKRGISSRQRENMELLDKIKQAYAISRGTYGSPRITVELQETGIMCGKNRVARLMRLNRIAGKDQTQI